MPTRFIARFQGTVQGVGFRYTTEHIARRFRVSGYVKNLRDGSVEVVGEGIEGELQNFLKAIQSSQLGGYIRNTEISWNDGPKCFETFEVAF